MHAMVEFPQIFDCCAAIDVHKETVAVTLKIENQEKQIRTLALLQKI